MDLLEKEISSVDSITRTEVKEKDKNTIEDRNMDQTMRIKRLITIGLMLIVIMFMQPIIGSAQINFSAFQQTYGGTADELSFNFINTNDGGYAIIGATKSYGQGNWDVALIKTNADGGIEWSKTYGASGQDRGFSIDQTSDGGYVIGGETYSYGPSNQNSMVIKVDSLGTIEWSKVYHTNYNEYVRAIRQTDDGGYICVGYGIKIGGSDVFLYKIDSAGTKQWTKAYGGTADEFPHSLSLLPNGDFFVTGYRKNYNATWEIFASLIDSSGTFSWAKYYSGTGTDQGSTGKLLEITPAQHNGYILAAYTNTFGAGGEDALLLRIDSAGALLWNKAYGSTSNDRGQAVALLDDGGFLLTGVTEGFGATNSDLYSVKVDSSGNHVSSSIYGGSGTDYQFQIDDQVQIAPDGNYVILGYTTGYGAGAKDNYFVKTAQDGVSGCNETNSVSTTVTTGSSITATTWNMTTSTPSVTELTVTTLTTGSPSFTHNVQCFTPGANRYWVADSTGNWDDTLNWAYTSGGAGGAGVPVDTSTVFFDGNGTGDCQLNVAVSVDSFVVRSGYSGAIYQAAFDFTVDRGMVFNGGTFEAVEQLVDIGNDFIQHGGVFNAEGTTFDVGGDFSMKYLTGAQVKTEISDVGVLEVKGDIILDADTSGKVVLRLSDDAIVKLEGNVDRVNAYGSIDADSLGNTTIIYQGKQNQIIAPNQVFGGGTDEIVYNDLTIAKDSGTIKTDGDVLLTGKLTIDYDIYLKEGDITITNAAAYSLDHVSGTLHQTGKINRYTNSTSEYIFPISGEIDSVQTFSEVALTRNQTNMQTFAVNRFGSDGFAITHDPTRHTGLVEDIKAKIELPDGLVTLEYQLGTDGLISSDSVLLIPQVGLVTDSMYLQTDGNLFFSTEGDQISIYSVTHILSVLPVKKYNWIHNFTYNENGTLIGEQKQFTDCISRPTQVKTRNLTENKTLTTQTVYDAYSRPAIQTLQAPTGSGMHYTYGFMNDANTNQHYSYLSFDEDYASSGVAAPVSATGAQSVGRHYSDNGEEFVATTDYPYSRTTYSKDPLGNPHKVAQPGEAHRIGSGHESEAYSMYSGDELNEVFGTDSSYQVQMVDDVANGHRLDNSPYAITEAIRAQKTVAYDAEGKEAITYTVDGLVIASCISGASTSCPDIEVTKTMLGRSNRSIDIHLPASGKSSLAVPTTPQYTINSVISNPVTYNVPSNEYEYRFVDLRDNQLMVEGTDYSISEGSVTFLGGYASGSSIFRITYALNETFIDSIEDGLSSDQSLFINDLDFTYDIDYSHWSVNYYDISGRLRKTVSPKGFDCNNPGVHTMSSTFDYNNLGQLIAVEKPDEGKTEMMYDNEGKLRFSQNAVQRDSSEFSYLNYDQHGRTVESGMYRTIDPAAPFQFQNYYDYPTLGAGIESTDSILNMLDGLADAKCTERSITIYDQLATADEISGYTHSSSYPSDNLMGRVAKTYNDNNSTWYSYDQFGRLKTTVQLFSDTKLGASVDSRTKTLDYTYDHAGRVTRQDYMKQDEEERAVHDFTYDSDGRLTEAELTDGESVRAEGKFYYYLDGRLKRKEIDGDLQGMDYIYTLLGALKSVNHSSLDSQKDPGQDGVAGTANAAFMQDAFGFTLDYFNDDYTRTGTDVETMPSTGSRYDGLIKRMRWRQQASNVIQKNGTDFVLYSPTDATKELISEYNYDHLNRLANSNFEVYNNSNQTISSNGYFKVGGPSSGNIDYDRNGNILELDRGDGYSNGFDKDKLLYTYSDNRLTHIQDTSATSPYYSDFETGGLNLANTYNRLGQLTRSKADDVDNITYYSNGLVKKVEFGYGAASHDLTEYYYNERGQRIKSVFTDVTNGKSKYTWYALNTSGAIMSIYEKDEAGSNVLEQTDIPVYGMGRMGIYNAPANKAYYELTDHLGNVRTTVSRDAQDSIRIDSWSDYYPFGAVLPGRSADLGFYRFGYQGQEKVENSTWENFQLRMYNAELGRFMSIDPYAQFHSPYLAMGNNPISQIDPDGGQSINAGGNLTITQMQRLGWSSQEMHNYNLYGSKYDPVQQREMQLAAYKAHRDALIYDQIVKAKHMANGSSAKVQNELRGLIAGISDELDALQVTHNIPTGGGVNFQQSTPEDFGLPMNGASGGTSANGASAMVDFWKWQDKLQALRDNGFHKDEVTGDYLKLVTKGHGYTTNHGRIAGGVNAEIVVVSSASLIETGTSTSQRSNWGGVNGTGSDPSLTWKTPVGGALLYGASPSSKRFVAENSSQTSSRLSKALSETKWGQNKINFLGKRRLYTHTVNGAKRYAATWGRFAGRWATRFAGPVGWGLLIYDVASYMHDETQKVVHDQYDGDFDAYRRDVAPYGMKCFIAGTKITMFDGSLKNIEDVREGDVVKTYNLETKRIEDNLVLEIESPNHSDLVEIGFEHGIENTNTFDHPYYVKGKGWCSYKPDETLIKYGLRASQLEVGDLCYLYKDDSLIETKVISLNENVRLERTYNLSNVGNNNNFFANGILVHNKFIINNEKIEDNE